MLFVIFEMFVWNHMSVVPFRKLSYEFQGEFNELINDEQNVAFLCP